MRDMPGRSAISYAVTVFNKAVFLPYVLASIAAERARTGGEILLLDDGSTDTSGALLAAFAGREADVTLIAQTNAGVAAATNRVLAACRHDMVRLVDGDDLLLPGSTEALHAALEATGADAAYGGFAHWSPDEPLPIMAPPQGPAERLPDPLRAALTSQLFIPSALLARRQALLAALPLPENFRTSQDFALSLRLARRGSIARLAGPVCLLARDAPGRLSASQARMYADSARIVAVEWAGWPERYRRYALRRAAHRAYLYALRHLRIGAPGLARLQLWRLRSFLPIPIPDRALDGVARIYDQAQPSAAMGDATPGHQDHGASRLGR
jgi:glycosyltransferase involved in cell wall biosynthesis